MCDSIKETAGYTCITCGRTAEKAEMICKTIKLH
jgi:DNA-directed RNA polymerase subunit RPC12/RpoP